MPDISVSSPVAYDMYPKQKISKVSFIEDTVKKRIFLSNILAIRPYNIPIPSDPELRAKKLPIIW